MARSFDVEIPPCDPPDECVTTDLAPLGEQDRVDAIQHLINLTDDDLHDFDDVEWDRGPLGAWVLVVRDDWAYLCQWDRGMPSLWRHGQGRGRLTVERVKRRRYLADLLAEPPT